MARKPFDEIGRGNEDIPKIEDIPASHSNFTITIGSGVTASNFGIGDSTSFLLTIPVASGDTNTFTTLEVFNSGTADSANRSVSVSSATTPAAIATAIAAGLNFTRTGTSAVPKNYIAIVDDTVIHVSLNSGGVSSTPTNTRSVSGVAIGTFTSGAAGTQTTATEYVFDGPFTNALPVGDPLQGMALAARAYTTFLKSFSVLGAESAIDNLVSTNKSTITNAFPASIGGVVRSSAGKIPVRGFKQNSRGIKNLDFVFTNETANKSVRQLILRIYDSMIDFYVFVNDAGSDFVSSKNFAVDIIRDFEIETGELDRAIGEFPTLYNNTVVDRSSDQGLLIYSDSMFDAFNTLSISGSTFADFKTSVSNISANNLRKLKLKN